MVFTLLFSGMLIGLGIAIICGITPLFKQEDPTVEQARFVAEVTYYNPTCNTIERYRSVIVDKAYRDSCCVYKSLYNWYHDIYTENPRKYVFVDQRNYQCILERQNVRAIIFYKE